ncbi:hypothetical protein NSK_002595 [Nannochloropsis salina CCMP1776]|uniref:Uncharacterized protein n=1 Tax=Nannochloropsis salina CCMP1776 TaxID=1027361 RepID=A0A4D9D7Q1_9STRA|nr:hypothetical protein NSK_002595 [Nannochloropsis salina CCMP1776]|eukprot:TFJ86387.1 hypothetical protein NSK_002595 [Nannochloropsis salina CCMP1776]
MFFVGVEAFPKLLTEGKKCATPLAIGQSIMGAPVELGKDEVVTVTRADGTAMKSGDAYKPGETLTIGPGCFRAWGGGFVDGLCGDRRILPNVDGFAEYKAPKDGLDVMIWAGFAAKHGAVTVTQGFLLKGAKGTRAFPPGVAPPPPSASTTNVAKKGGAAGKTSTDPAKEENEGRLRGGM